VTPTHNRVLVVDDEKAIADLIELYLRNENYCLISEIADILLTVDTGLFGLARGSLS